MELLGDGDACSKLTELLELPRDSSVSTHQTLTERTLFSPISPTCYDQTFNKCLPEQMQAADPKGEEETSAPEEQETCEMKEGKE